MSKISERIPYSSQAKAKVHAAKICWSSSTSPNHSSPSYHAHINECPELLLPGHQSAYKEGFSCPKQITGHCHSLFFGRNSGISGRPDPSPSVRTLPRSRTPADSSSPEPSPSRSRSDDSRSAPCLRARRHRPYRSCPGGYRWAPRSPCRNWDPSRSCSGGCCC